MDEIFKPLLSNTTTTPSPSKFHVNVTWCALAPMDERNQTPNITFVNTRWNIEIWVQHSMCVWAGFEYFVHVLYVHFSHIQSWSKLHTSRFSQAIRSRSDPLRSSNIHAGHEHGDHVAFLQLFFHRPAAIRQSTQTSHSLASYSSASWAHIHVYKIIYVYIYI